MVASWMRDDVVNHQVLVLIGRQGIFKTTWLERLIPPQLRAYCCKLANTTQINKDDRLRLAEFGLINLDELDSMSSRELNTMKSIITASDVNERAAYGYTKERKIRLASFCASSNRREFMTTAQISERLVTYGNIKKPMPLNRLGVLLGTAGYVPVRHIINGAKLRGWLVYQRSSDEVNALKRILRD
jgi:predicted P-loop ATPase